MVFHGMLTEEEGWASGVALSSGEASSREVSMVSSDLVRVAVFVLVFVALLSSSEASKRSSSRRRLCEGFFVFVMIGIGDR